MRLLVVEDNPKLAAHLSRGLAHYNHTVKVCGTGSEGEAAATEGRYDAVILDINLPDRSGITVCRELRRHGIDVPVIMLTVFSATSDKIRGLEAGADDYLAKPFELEELEARLRALQRRRNLSNSIVLTHADLTLDLTRHVATRGTRQIALSRREFHLLEILMQHAGTVLDRDTIARATWGGKFDKQSNVIDVYVHALRRKIDRGFDRPLIHTVVGRGYVLDSAWGQP